MKVKHTKGEWESSKSNSDDTAIGIRSKTALVATVWISKFYNDVPNKKEAEANANLIVKSPVMHRFMSELVEALKDKGKLDIWETTLLTNAKEILNDE